MDTVLDLNGIAVWKGLLDRARQEEMVAALRDVAAVAPLRQYRTPGGRPMSVRMSGAGARAWVADRDGYRYAERQPDGSGWPEIPACILDVWDRVAGTKVRPDSCLVNFYGEGTKMGMHQDRDEADLSHPVVSISLGDEALFRVGGVTRGGRTQSVWLASGDVAVLQGTARLAYHGIDRIKFGTSTLLERGGRLNVTLRVAGACNNPGSAPPTPGTAG